ncbi:ABC transporter permease [Allonocardiopsis opalescens]|uniref:ABC-2 type transport system permease protein n=1 Tax=Allonocardiopsis opalescens TaxID=1144618 RepID=A0A2T0Q1G9_9ACTN|nr:antibiotic ABC transporter [Allonocardiopsis opalescens]PRX97652.1 ABC-2 type transport system permease protein [Allonocardiopsis opalescens]
MTASSASGTPRRGPRSTPVTGTGTLIRLILRRDGLWLGAWLLLAWGVVVGRAATLDATYPTAQARAARYAEVMVEVPMFRLFQGPAYGDTAAALFAQETFGGATIVAALGAIAFTVRHTRADEEAGRAELLRSAVCGRHAVLTAALAVVLGAGALLGVLSAVTLVALGLPAAGSSAFGLVCAGAVGVAAALAAVAVQLGRHARTAGIGAFTVFFALHFVRGVSDLGGSGIHWIGWLVPNGWLQRVRPFADERWWALLPVLVLVIGAVGLAYRLSERRDLGSGLVPPRLGRASAPARLRGPVALAWRLNRPMALAWLAGAFAIALPTGYGGSGAMEQYAGGERMREWADAMGAADPGDAFFAYIAFAMGFPIAIYALMTVLRLPAEESDGTAEPLLAAPVTRARWAAGHLLVAAAVSAGLQLALGAGFGLGSGLSSGRVAAELVRMLTLTAGLIPAQWVMIGIAFAAFGAFGRRAPVVAWSALIIAITVEFGQHLGWPQWLFLAFSPFAHVLPFYGPPHPATLGTLVLLAAALCAVGLLALRRRDITS